MKLYDITQEVFSCKVFPGDPAPARERVLQIRNGDDCNLTAFNMCAHNGTHVDAPYHFYENGRSVDVLELERLIGPAKVAGFDGELGAQDAERLLSDGTRRILFKGKTVITIEAARTMIRRGVALAGVESQTVGPEDAPRQVHLELLGAEVAVLEGIRLTEVPEGEYFLFAAPLKLCGADGAPCRAVLAQGIGICGKAE